jgi:hypothetical protein
MGEILSDLHVGIKMAPASIEDQGNDEHIKRKLLQSRLTEGVPLLIYGKS